MSLACNTRMSTWPFLSDQSTVETVGHWCNRLVLQLQPFDIGWEHRLWKTGHFGAAPCFLTARSFPGLACVLNGEFAEVCCAKEFHDGESQVRFGGLPLSSDQGTTDAPGHWFSKVLHDPLSLLSHRMHSQQLTNS